MNRDLEISSQLYNPNSLDPGCNLALTVKNFLTKVNIRRDNLWFQQDRWKRKPIANGIIRMLLVDALISFILENEGNVFSLKKFNYCLADVAPYKMAALSDVSWCNQPVNDAYKGKNTTQHSVGLVLPHYLLCFGDQWRVSSCMQCRNVTWTYSSALSQM